MFKIKKISHVSLPKIIHFSSVALFASIGFYSQAIFSQNYCQNPKVTIAGSAQPVFIAQNDRCSENDVPDSPAMAFINSSNQVVLFNGIAGSYPSIGPNLNQVKRDCTQPLFANNPDKNAPPEAYFNYTWLRDPWTFDGNTIYALVHNEFHGWKMDSKYCQSGKQKRCIYFSIPAAISTNGGKSFQMVLDNDGNAVPAIISPFQYIPDGGQQGMIQQSNILSRTGSDGKNYYYILVQFTGGNGSKRGVCLVRNADISNPNTWKAWDGNGFNTTMNMNPYRNPNMNASQYVCQPVSQRLPASSWTYNTVLKEYISVGHMTLAQRFSRLKLEAFGYSVSPDMIHWSQPVAIQAVNWLIGYARSRPGSGIAGQAYPSLLDPTSAGRNFEFSGANPYLYFTQMPPKTGDGNWRNRNLYREPLNISCKD